MPIEILDIKRNPLQFIGKCAGICWNAPTDDAEKNIARAKQCIMDNHGRVEEFPDITIVFDGFSARMDRELSTHIGGSPTRLQSSTRYVPANDFAYYRPKSCDSDETRNIYSLGMEHTASIYRALLDLGVPKEDAANQLPLGMMSRMVWKVNMRTLVNFFNRRLCNRALKEIRDFSIELKNMLSEIDDEWKWICDNLFVPMCEQYKYLNPQMCFCLEKRGCGRHPHIEALNVTEKNESAPKHG